jgi:Asp-tRNA(Asn)/Glu-tRNA(Gln) amidotransferase A subunit family amidase
MPRPASTTPRRPPAGDNLPAFDTTLVERYKRAGLLIFGKTARPEMEIAPTSESAMYGPTRNP